jgi:hypothetical protein
MCHSYMQVCKHPSNRKTDFPLTARHPASWLATPVPVPLADPTAQPHTIPHPSCTYLTRHTATARPPVGCTHPNQPITSQALSQNTSAAAAVKARKRDPISGAAHHSQIPPRTQHAACHQICVFERKASHHKHQTILQQPSNLAHAQSVPAITLTLTVLQQPAIRRQSIRRQHC